MNDSTKYERPTRIVNGGLVLALSLLTMLADIRWAWLVVGMGVGLIATGVLNHCGTRAILSRMLDRKTVRGVESGSAVSNEHDD